MGSRVIDSSVGSVEKRPQPSQQPCKLPTRLHVSVYSARIWGAENIPQTPSGTAFP